MDQGSFLISKLVTSLYPHKKSRVLARLADFVYSRSGKVEKMNASKLTIKHIALRGTRQGDLVSGRYETDMAEDGSVSLGGAR